MLEINRLVVETTGAATDLCRLGGKYGTDKSPYNTSAVHRHPYTAVYDLLFASLRHSPIKFGELGILNNASMRMWRDYFSRARIFGFEYSSDLIEAARQHRLDVEYIEADVTSSSSLRAAFEHANGDFDILIDDSTHLFDHQINFVDSALKYVKPGGLIIVEDIFNGWDEQLYANNLDKFSHLIESATFIALDHELKFSQGMPEPYFDNDKILVIRRNAAVDTRSVERPAHSSPRTLFRNDHSPLSVFVVTHKPIARLEDESYFIIQAGSSTSRLDGMLHDDSGDNISQRNASFSELTAHYWIWKNVESEFVALIHYRRFLTARNEHFRYMDYEVASSRDLLEELRNVDIITAEPFVFVHYGTSMPESVEQHYVRHHGYEFVLARQALAALNPEYLDAFDAVMRNNKLYANNIMAMRKTLFNEYCSWAFPLFFRIESMMRNKRSDKYQSRVIAFLSERMFSVWMVFNSKDHSVAHRNMTLFHNV